VSRWSQSSALWAAVLAPLLVLIGFLLFLNFDRARREIEYASARRAAEIADLVDAAALSELKLASALSSSKAIVHDDIPAAYARAQELKAVSGVWRTVLLSDPIAGTEIFDLRRPLENAKAPIAPFVAAAAAAQSSGTPVIGNVMRDRLGTFVAPIHVPIMRGDRLHYILTVEMDTAAVQAIVTQRAPPGSVAAVVDRAGNFVGRSVAHEQRVGRPATRYVREAIAGAHSGKYKGVTYEGLINYTAFSTAPRTGWSAHVAVDSSLIDRPRGVSLALLVAVAAACLGASGLLALIAVRRMRDRRRDEERLRQSQKMEAVGQLTGGIAHDFNNLLMVIIGGLELVLKRTALDDPNRRHLEGAADAATRGAKLTSRLLAFSRTQRLARQRVDVRVVVDSLSDLLAQSLGPRIEVSIDVSEDARWVLTDENQLELALLNLAVNARDAMVDGGRVSISTRRARARGRSDRIEIIVADNGRGMTGDVAARAFDPFFTTKEVNRGTGLGLAQVYAMARQSDGDAFIESAPGQGARVHLLLPPAPAESESAEPAKSNTLVPNAHRGRRMLVVDDDAAVRRVIIDELRLLGFETREAASGAEALDQIRNDPPDLMLVDFLMPGLTGAEVARRAREMHPGQRIAFISGHMDNAALDSAAHGAMILRKPFHSSELAALVARALDLAPAAGPALPDPD
jgi:signal transduction histidine kinase/ActR/RegA family two-component response regulator